MRIRAVSRREAHGNPLGDSADCRSRRLGDSTTPWRARFTQQRGPARLNRRPAGRVTANCADPGDISTSSCAVDGSAESSPTAGSERESLCSPVQSIRRQRCVSTSGRSPDYIGAASGERVAVTISGLVLLSTRLMVFAMWVPAPDRAVPRARSAAAPPPDLTGRSVTVDGRQERAVELSRSRAAPRRAARSCRPVAGRPCWSARRAGTLRSRRPGPATAPRRTRRRPR
jgi:hypothetical protein